MRPLLAQVSMDTAERLQKGAREDIWSFVLVALGFAVVALAIAVWRSFEKRVAEQKETIEKFAAVIERNTLVIQANTQVLDRKRPPPRDRPAPPVPEKPA